MLNRLHRFHGLGSLNFVYKKGRVVRGPLFVLRFAPNNRQQQYRAAVVVSRKVHKSAVVRNRIRRRLYELIRVEIPATSLPYDIVLTVYSDKVASVDSAELRSSLISLLKKADLR